MEHLAHSVSSKVRRTYEEEKEETEELLGLAYPNYHVVPLVWSTTTSIMDSMYIKAIT